MASRLLRALFWLSLIVAFGCMGAIITIVYTTDAAETFEQVKTALSVPAIIAMACAVIAGLSFELRT